MDFPTGNILTDPSLPISDFKVSLQCLTGVYLRTFAVGNKLARVQVSVPFIKIFGNLRRNGHDTSGSRNGFADARSRLGINLTGTPHWSTIRPREICLTTGVWEPHGPGRSQRDNQ